MRIWYQSYVDYENGKTDWDRLGEYIKSIVDPGTEVDIKGITPHDSYAHSAKLIAPISACRRHTSRIFLEFLDISILTWDRGPLAGACSLRYPSL